MHIHIYIDVIITIVQSASIAIRKIQHPSLVNEALIKNSRKDEEWRTQRREERPTLSREAQ